MNLNDTILRHFVDFYLYDTNINFENIKPEIQRQKIKVIEESICVGASIPTYVVKYQNGKIARTSKDMYSLSQEDADSKLFNELLETKISMENQRLVMDMNIEKLNTIIDELQESVSLIGFCNTGCK